MFVNNQSNIKENLNPINLIHSENKETIHDEDSKQISIMFEYKLFQLYGPIFGIYVIPQLDNIYQWNCIIFIRQGFYKDAKFKFNLIFPNNFPEERPNIVFESKVYHPLVDYRSGELDVKTLIPKWIYIKQNMLYTVFFQIKQMFLDKQKLMITNSFNPEAGKRFNQKIHIFLEKVIDCVEQSKLNLHKNSRQTSLIIKEEKCEEIHKIKCKLEEICEVPNSYQEKKRMMLNFLLK